jgi:hypothetical protein
VNFKVESFEKINFKDESLMIFRLRCAGANASRQTAKAASDEV